MKLHRDLLLAIWNAFTPGVIMYDKNNNFVNRYSNGNIKCLTDFQKLFDTKYRNATTKKPARHTLVMKFKTAMSLKEMKSHKSIDKLITQNNIYITQNLIQIYTLEIGTPGWIYGKHPTHHNKTSLKECMLHDIETALPSSMIPFFHLAAGTVGRSENNGSFKTTAIIIHVDEKSKQALHQMLKKTYKGQN